MKKWVLLGIGGAILLVAGYLLFSFYTVTFMGSQLQRGFGPGMSIGKMEVRVTHLSVREIRLEDPGSKRRILQIEEVKIYPSLMALFKGIWKIQEVLLVKPVFQFSRSRDGSWMGPFPHKAEEGDKGTDESRRKEKDGINLEIGKVRVEDGAVEFEDHPDGKQPVQIRLTHLEFRIKDIRYPVPSRSSSFELKGKVKGMTGEGELEGIGWIHLETLDQEATFKMNKVDVRILEPYYRKKVSATIDAGQIGLESKISIKGKVIDAPGTVELSDLRVGQEGTVFWIPATTLVPLLNSRGNRIRARFHINGNLADPKFNLGESFLTQVGLSLAEALGLPVRILGEKILEGAGQGTAGTHEGMKSIADLFKKKKKKE